VTERYHDTCKIPSHPDLSSSGKLITRRVAASHGPRIARRSSWTRNGFFLMANLKFHHRDDTCKLPSRPDLSSSSNLKTRRVAASYGPRIARRSFLTRNGFFLMANLKFHHRESTCKILSQSDLYSSGYLKTRAIAASYEPRLARRSVWTRIGFFEMAKH
jgi:hypothetical protein